MPFFSVGIYVSVNNVALAITPESPVNTLVASSTYNKLNRQKHSLFRTLKMGANTLAKDDYDIPSKNFTNCIAHAPKTQAVRHWDETLYEAEQTTDVTTHKANDTDECVVNKSTAMSGSAATIYRS